MKRKYERQYVTIAEEKRDGRSPCHVLTWFPTPNQRERARYEDKVAAEREADRIEDLIRRGFVALAHPDIQKELAATILLRDQLAPGVPLPKIIQAYAQTSLTTVVLIKDAGQAFIVSRSDPEKFSERHIETVRHHVGRFIGVHGNRALTSVPPDELEKYFKVSVGGAPKTRHGHFITIRSLYRWSRDVKRWLPWGEPTPADLVVPVRLSNAEHEVYSPEEFIRILIFAPTKMLTFFLLGQFAGIRAEERIRLMWEHWRSDEDNKLVVTDELAKGTTARIRRRRVDVPENLAEWLLALRGKDDEPIVAVSDPHRYTAAIYKAAKVKSKQNALRAGYASYHLELHDNAALTAKNDGHSVGELEGTYKSIKGVTKEKARQMFNITPSVVIAFAQANKLPMPEWANKYAALRVVEA